MEAKEFERGGQSKSVGFEQTGVFQNLFPTDFCVIFPSTESMITRFTLLHD